MFACSEIIFSADFCGQTRKLDPDKSNSTPQASAEFISKTAFRYKNKGLLGLKPKETPTCLGGEKGVRGI